MPVMGGYEINRQLRLDPATRQIPVVFCSAHYGERDAKELGLSSGVSHVLAKPFESEEVLRVVERALSGTSKSGGTRDQCPLPAGFDPETLRPVPRKPLEKTRDLQAASERLRALIHIRLPLPSGPDPDRLPPH